MKSWPVRDDSAQGERTIDVGFRIGIRQAANAAEKREQRVAGEM
jgi:hypothetical protein